MMNRRKFRSQTSDLLNDEGRSVQPVRREREREERESQKREEQERERVRRKKIRRERERVREERGQTWVNR